MDVYIYRMPRKREKAFSSIILTCKAIYMHCIPFSLYPQRQNICTSAKDILI